MLMGDGAPERALSHSARDRRFVMHHGNPVKRGALQIPPQSSNFYARKDAAVIAFARFIQADFSGTLSH
jgi:hypothetical protein